MKIPFMKLGQAPSLHISEDYPLFNRISIETHSKCNRSCVFCPISTGRRDHELTYMDSVLYADILEELSELEFNGVVQFFLLNEPLLDHELIEKLAQLRKACPKVTIYISTNGDVIASQKDPLSYLRGLNQAGLNVINLNIYDEGDAGEKRKQFYKNLLIDCVSQRLADVTTRKYAKHSQAYLYMCITDMRVSRTDAAAFDMFHERTAEDKVGITTVPQLHCARPNRHLVVRYDGKVPLCCALDPTHDSTPFMGDVTKKSLSMIWQSEPMMKYRWFLQQKRRELPGCSTCTHKMSYSHCIRHIYAPEHITNAWEEECRKS